MGRKVFLGQNLIWVMVVLGQIHVYKSCVLKESKALLDFKTYFISHSENSQQDFDHTKFILADWINDTKSDCCRWSGVKCNRTSGRVIGLTFAYSLFQPQRSLINLSLLHPFEELQCLDLYAGYNEFGGFFDNVEGYESLRRLRKLEILDLSSNNFGNSIFPFLSAATSLKTLFLRDNNIVGYFPIKELKDLINLELLDLSGNKFNGSIPIRVLPAFRKLKALDLSDNEFSGSMELQGICELNNLQELVIRNSKLVGEFPLCITNMSRLRVLDFSSGQMTGEVPSALGNLLSLEYVSLLDNSFNGFFSLSSVANLSELRVFKLSSKSNSLQVVLESSWKPKFQLSVIELRYCNLEKIPHFLLHQKDLRHVDISHNKIYGVFPSWLLANNTKLEALLLRNNSFTVFQLPILTHNLVYLDVSINKFNHMVPENIGWILPRLLYMDLANNRFQGNLPSSLGNMGMIELLDITHNSFHGMLPISLLQGCYSMKFLKLSHNKLSGEVLAESANFTHISILAMDNNQFTGNIREGFRGLKSLTLLDISNNNLTGVIPGWFDENPSLYALLLSGNSLEGEIPVSLFNISGLRLLNLSANILSGQIPSHNSFESDIGLFLQGNNLSGDIPETLLRNVAILDLRNNRLSGCVPEFIDIESIGILLLRGNKLTGRIPHKLCGLRNIHLLDLSNNRLNGSIPSCLSNTSFSLKKEDKFYGYEYGVTHHNGYERSSFSRVPNLFSTDKVGMYFKSRLMLEMFNMIYLASTYAKIEFVTKHRHDVYMGGNLELFYGLDLSENELSGEIPLDLGSLQLQALNLSHNKLSGVIPVSFSGIKDIESLDLSFNRLQGCIPPQLTDLNRLAVFNVSYNNLSEVIPQGKQFNTFDTRSYLGNPLLCGKPTNKSCDNNKAQEPKDGVEADGSLIDMASFYWSVFAAYVTTLVVILASLSFELSWRTRWFNIVDAFIHKLKNLLW